MKILLFLSFISNLLYDQYFGLLSTIQFKNSKLSNSNYKSKKSSQLLFEEMTLIPDTIPSIETAENYVANYNKMNLLQDNYQNGYLDKTYDHYDKNNIIVNKGNPLLKSSAMMVNENLFNYNLNKVQYFNSENKNKNQELQGEVNYYSYLKSNHKAISNYNIEDIYRKSDPKFVVSSYYLNILFFTI